MAGGNTGWHAGHVTGNMGMGRQETNVTVTRTLLTAINMRNFFRYPSFKVVVL